MVFRQSFENRSNSERKPWCIFRAAELMVKSGANVTLRIAKQGAIYHGLATLLNQPAQIVTRGMNMRHHRALEGLCGIIIV